MRRREFITCSAARPPGGRSSPTRPGEMPCRTSRPEIRGGKAGTERSYCDYQIAAVAPLRWSYGTLKPRFGGAFLSAILGLGHCIALARVRVAKPGSSLIPAIVAH